MQSGKFNTKDCKPDCKVPFYSGKATNPSGCIDKVCFQSDSPYLIFIKDGGAGPGKYGDTIGICKTYQVVGDSAGTSHVLALFPTSICCVYLRLVLAHFRNQLMDLAHYTTNLGVIRKSDLASFKIPLPTAAIQQQCIAIFTAKEQHLQTLDERIQREEQHIADLQQLGKDVIAAFCNGGGD